MWIWLCPASPTINNVGHFSRAFDICTSPDKPLSGPRLHLSTLAWAELAYKQLVDGQGKKEDQVKDERVQEQPDEETPICAVHQVPMVKQRGKYWAFWSCHERNADGRFCSYKPEGR